MSLRRQSGLTMAFLLSAGLACSGTSASTDSSENGGTTAQSAAAGASGTVNTAKGGGAASAGVGSSGSGTTASEMGGSPPSTGGTTATSTAGVGNPDSTVCTTFAKPTIVGTIAASGLTELSGMVESRKQPGVLYAHADSGGTATVFVMNETGKALGTITLTGAPCTDWEDIATGVDAAGTHYVYVADIGDNASRTGTGTPRTSIQVLRFVEPDVATLNPTSTLTIGNWQSINLAYPNGTHDAETLFVDPLTEDLVIVTKDTSGQSFVYRAPSSLFGGSATTKLEPVGTVTVGTSGTNSALIAAGDISPTGDRVILRTYTAILLFPRQTTWENTFAAVPVTLPSATEPQSEGLTFNSDGTAWLSAGEQSASIHQGVQQCP